MWIIACILVLFSGFFSVTAGPISPRNSLLFKNVLFYNGSIIPCQKITWENACPPGHEIVEQCDYPQGPMKCVPCRTGYFQCDFITTDTAMKCYPPGCPELGTETTVKVRNNSDGTCHLECVCNEEKGYSGTDYMDCTLQKTVCSTDSELRNGVCVGCKKGFHNPNPIFGRCVPEPTTTPPDVTSASSDGTFQPTMSVPTSITSASTSTTIGYTKTTDQSSTSGSDAEGGSVLDPVKSLNIPLGISITGLVIALVVACILCLKKRARKGTVIYNIFHVDNNGTQSGVRSHYRYAHVDPDGQPTRTGEGCASCHLSGLSETQSQGQGSTQPAIASDEENLSDITPVTSSTDVAHPRDNTVDQAPEQAVGTSDSNQQGLNIALLFAKDDEDLSFQIKESLNKIVLKDSKRICVLDFDHPIFGGSRINLPQQFTSVCSLVLVVLTENTSRDTICRFMIEEAVAQTRLVDKQSQKTYSVMPLHTEPEENRTYNIPNGLASVRAVDWFGPKHEDKLTDLLNCLVQEQSLSSIYLLDETERNTTNTE